jgi:hypothetical protein
MQEIYPLCLLRRHLPLNLGGEWTQKIKIPPLVSGEAGRGKNMLLAILPPLSPSSTSLPKLRGRRISGNATPPLILGEAGRGKI